MGSCRKIAGLFGAYIYGDLTPEEMRKVRLHAERCEACARELQAMSKAVAMVPAEVPTLSDEERQRIMWTVKGAVRAQQESTGFRLFSPSLAWGVAITTVVVAAFVGGTILGLRSKPPREKAVAKRPPSKEKPAQLPETPDSVAKDHMSPTGPPIIPSPATLAIAPPSRDQVEPPYRGHKDWLQGIRPLRVSPDQLPDTQSDNPILKDPSSLLAPIPETPGSADLGRLGEAPEEPSLDAPGDDPTSTPPDNPPTD